MMNEEKYTFEIVVEMLKGYKDLKRAALQLEFEIKNFISIATEEDIIDSMTFGKLEDNSVEFSHKGSTTDKTAKIAVSYAEKATSLNIKHKNELEYELRLVSMEILRMEYYVGLLGEKHSKILKMLYFDGYTYLKAAEESKLSVTAVKKLRTAGIRRLVEMYNFIIS